MFPVFIGEMQGTDSAQSASWFVEPDQVRREPQPRLRLPKRASDASSLRAIIVSCLFLVPLATSLFLGGHFAIDPLLQMAITARDSRAMGTVVRAMPDGKFCRHMTFDNDTAEVLEGPIERCTDDVANEMFRTGPGKKFSWAHDYSWQQPK